MLKIVCTDDYLIFTTQHFYVDHGCCQNHSITWTAFVMSFHPEELKQLSRGNIAFRTHSVIE